MLRQRWIVLAAWLSVLLLLAAWNALNLRLGTDLSQFLPRGASQQDQVLLSQVRGGIAARTLLLRISGAQPSADLADASRALAAALRNEEGFFQIANGETTLDASATDAALFNHRYLIGPPRDCADALTEAGLRSALRERLGELASGMAMLDKQRLAADPTACYRQLLGALVPQRTPNRQHGVWFSPDGRHALLVVITAAQASDLAAQRLAISEVQNTFGSLPQSAGLSLELAGPGYFAISSEQRIKTETTLLSIAASIAVALILAFAFRSTSLVLLGMLPLLSGIMLGAAVVTLLFGFVHGITLALGITLLGVALDYPVHVYAHAADNPSQRTSTVWHTLLLGMVTTVLGYAALAWTNFDGLSQLGIFAAVGLATAALTSRYLLPSLMPGDYRLPRLRSVAVLQSRLRPVSAPVRLWLLLSSLAAVGLLLLLHGDPWETDIRRLSVVPQAELDKDRLIREQLGAPDVARLLYVLADQEADVLGRLNAALPDLQRLQAGGLIDGFDNIARWLPSPDTQRLRQAMLPDRAELAAALERANADLPFRIDQLAPFLDDVERSRSLPPLRAEDLADSPFAARVSMLLQPLDGGWLGLVPLSGVAGDSAVSALQALAARHGLTYLDLRDGTAGLLSGFFAETFDKLLVTAAIIAVTLAFALRSLQRLQQVLVPIAIAVTITFGLVLLLHGAVNLFHLVSLLLVAGLAIDYSLFLSRPAVDRADQQRTVFSVSVGALSSFAMFAMLALSQVPALEAVGSTVAIGIACAYTSSLLLAAGEPVG